MAENDYCNSEIWVSISLIIQIASWAFKCISKYMFLFTCLNHSVVSLCDPIDCSPPSSSVHGILKARVLEWVAIPFSRGASDPGVKPGSSALQADSLPLSQREALNCYTFIYIWTSSLKINPNISRIHDFGDITIQLYWYLKI